MTGRRRFHFRIYVSSDSYPEIRPIPTGWPRHRAWWRAFRSAFGDSRLWLLALIEIALVLIFIGIREQIVAGFAIGWDARGPVTIAVVFAALFVIAAVHLSWGGDLMRPHLRRTNELARDACPNCGHLLTSQLGDLEAARREQRRAASFDDADQRVDQAVAAPARDAPAEPAERIRCPECGHHVPTSTFEPPYAIPPEYRAAAYAPPPTTD